MVCGLSPWTAAFCSRASFPGDGPSSLTRRRRGFFPRPRGLRGGPWRCSSTYFPSRDFFSPLAGDGRTCPLGGLAGFPRRAFSSLRAGRGVAQAPPALGSRAAAPASGMAAPSPQSAGGVLGASPWPGANGPRPPAARRSPAPPRPLAVGGCRWRPSPLFPSGLFWAARASGPASRPGGHAEWRSVAFPVALHSSSVPF